MLNLSKSLTSQFNENLAALQTMGIQSGEDLLIVKPDVLYFGTGLSEVNSNPYTTVELNSRVEVEVPPVLKINTSIVPSARTLALRRHSPSPTKGSSWPQRFGKWTAGQAIVGLIGSGALLGSHLTVLSLHGNMKNLAGIVLQGK